jgi:hypothetical protein
MTNISVQALGCVVPPEKTALAREAYFRAISRLGYDDSDFADVAPERLDARLARLVIRFAVQGSEDAAGISERALSTLQALPRPRSLWTTGTSVMRGPRDLGPHVPLNHSAA